MKQKKKISFTVVQTVFPKVSLLYLFTYSACIISLRYMKSD